MNKYCEGQRGGVRGNSAESWRFCSQGVAIAKSCIQRSAMTRLAPRVHLANVAFIACSLCAALVLQPGRLRGQMPPPAAPAATVAANVNSALNGIDAALANADASRWHAKNSIKEDFLQRGESIHRNVTTAVPSMLAHFQGSPNDLGAAFTLYRDAQTVYDVADRASEEASRHGKSEEKAAIASSLTQLQQALNALASYIQTQGAVVNAELQNLQRARQAAGVPASNVRGRTVIINNGYARRRVIRRRVARHYRRRRVVTRHAVKKKGATQPKAKPTPAQH